jgi:hypothetical protein
MKLHKKSYHIKIVRIEDHSTKIASQLVKQTIEKILEKYGLVSYNLDEVIAKHISEEMRYGS